MCKNCKPPKIIMPKPTVTVPRPVVQASPSRPAVIHHPPPTTWPGRPAAAQPRMAHAAARPGVLQSMWSFGSSGNTISDGQWFNGARGTVFATMINDNGNDGFFKNNKSVTYGNEHAEDVWLRDLTADVIAGNYATPGLNQVILCVTASPCTSVSRAMLPTTSNKVGVPGCTERLINLATNGVTHLGKNYRFQVNVICEHLYQPKVTGAKEASRRALQAMITAGIKVSCEREDP